MDYNRVRKERAIEHLETATCSPTTADEKYICNWGGGAFLNGRVWDTFILFAMHITLLYKTESNNLKKMEAKKKKGARKQICFQICMPAACGGGRNSKMQSRGAEGAPVVGSLCLLWGWL